MIPSILEGQHHIILAPTAGGKTEAAFFPVLSRMLTEGWPALSVLYICPIKALLNNLDIRLQRYCTLVGRRSALWHGDVKTTDRKHILREPPDCLLTTPESLEVMLVSPNVDSARLFANLQAVIVDEIHAFAGDDRGWHLLSVLERVQRLAGRELQRIGLSATVGNPDDLADGWPARVGGRAASSCRRRRRAGAGRRQARLRRLAAKRRRRHLPAAPRREAAGLHRQPGAGGRTGRRTAATRTSPTSSPTARSARSSVTRPKKPSPHAATVSSSPPACWNWGSTSAIWIGSSRSTARRPCPASCSEWDGRDAEQEHRATACFWPLATRP